MSLYHRGTLWLPQTERKKKINLILIERHIKLCIEDIKNNFVYMNKIKRK